MRKLKIHNILLIFLIIGFFSTTQAQLLLRNNLKRNKSDIFQIIFTFKVNASSNVQNNIYVKGILKKRDFPIKQGKVINLSKQYKRDNDPWVAPDKVKHFLSGMIITMNSFFFLNRYGNQSSANAKRNGILITAGLSVGKEIWDKRSPQNHFCWKDLTMDALGIFVGILLVQNS